ncbi:MAG TPA: hypothetical protein VGM26_02900 [Rhizomicrobium sp.]|jgi:hypothetical protein
MFAAGTNWRKKLSGITIAYVIFLALGLIYASRIFHRHQLATDGMLLLLPLVGTGVIWGLYKKKTDPQFAARAAERKANPTPQAKIAAGRTPLYIALFHGLFLFSVLAFKSMLDALIVFAPSRDMEIILATAAATALAGLAVMALVGHQERQAARVAAQV